MTDRALAANFFADYDSFGVRRAGSAGDLASAAWLAGQVARIQTLQSVFQDVHFRRFLPGESSLRTDGHPPVEGLPLFDGGLTQAQGIKGGIGPLGSDAEIGFAVMEPAMASLPDNAFARARAESRHRAIVIALTTREGGLAPLNAHDSDRPFGPPVLQIAGRDAPGVVALSERAAQVTVTVTGQYEAASSRNVRAALQGAGPPLLLLTPRTSWWTSTAERAGGVYAWVQSLQALAASTSRKRAVVGLATCGHELGHLGAHHAFAREPQLASESALVLHLGANLGTATAPALTVRSNVEGLADQMRQRLMDAGYPADAIHALSGGKANGEAHEIERRGGRYLSLIGSNPWFHAPEDRWPVSIDLDRACAIANSVTALALAECAS
ncbi:MAG: hypothetical protein FJY25_09980 [Betaproteobacteria bacterium]|nr:hypothetical protein [Betaproteobacteria bacterium]